MSPITGTKTVSSHSPGLGGGDKSKHIISDEDRAAELDTEVLIDAGFLDLTVVYDGLRTVGVPQTGRTGMEGIRTRLKPEPQLGVGLEQILIRLALR